MAFGVPAVPPDKVLEDIADVGGLVLAVVTSVDESTAVAWARDVGPVEIGFESMDWARPYINDNRRGDPPKSTAQALRRAAERAISPYRSPVFRSTPYPAFRRAISTSPRCRLSSTSPFRMALRSIRA